MVDIINWLAKNELEVGNLYERAADYFHENKNLRLFLKSLAADEQLHFHIMEKAAGFYKMNPVYESAVIIDNEINERISGILDGLNRHLDAGTLTESILCDSIIDAEFSEWNGIFLYIVKTLQKDVKEFDNIGKSIQKHKYKVEQYYENHPEFRKKIKKYKKLQPVWKEKILIVDDNELIIELLTNILQRIGDIDTASDGIEALAKLKKKSYKLIISDIDMPKMDGLTFFKNSNILYPDMNKRFLFFTGEITSERLTFFNDEKVGYIKKPERIDIIRDKAMQILAGEDKASTKT